MNINKLLNQSMVDPMDDIARQARQGSVAAIIQVLNEKLADFGVRTRAVLANGVLQVLCEAATVDQLQQSTLVARIREILESLSPRNIRRVHINSRIVREQQLLWLEEISRDPANQLLWSQQITLAKPNIIKQLVQDMSDRKRETAKAVLAQAAFPRQVRSQRQSWRSIIVGVGVSFVLVTFAWALYQSLGTKQEDNQQGTAPHQLSLDWAFPTAKSKDPFADAVRLAQQASADRKVAQTSSDWLIIAAKWQQASELMAKVPSKHPRYKDARSRIESYSKSSENAQEEAKKKRRR